MKKPKDVEALKLFIRSKVEEKIGYKPVSSPDYVRLSESIQESTHEYVSPTTLKRIWGYIEGWQRPRPGILNAIARYLGFANSHDLEIGAGLSDDSISGSMDVRHLVSAKLPEKCLVKIMWYPERELIVRHLSDNLFEIARVVNSHCHLGATFYCDIMIEGQPLMLKNYLPNDNEGLPGAYECGRCGGIKFEIVNEF